MWRSCHEGYLVPRAGCWWFRREMHKVYLVTRDPFYSRRWNYKGKMVIFSLCNNFFLPLYLCCPIPIITLREVKWKFLNPKYNKRSTSFWRISIYVIFTKSTNGKGIVMPMDFLISSVWKPRSQTLHEKIRLCSTTLLILLNGENYGTPKGYPARNRSN